MKSRICAVLLVASCAVPSVAMAKGIPMVYNSGEEMFEIKGAESIDTAMKLGYVCQRFGLFGADIWTWDCKMMAIDPARKAVAPLPADMYAKYSGKYTESDRVRGFWEHYGFLTLLAVGLAYLGFQIIKD